MAYPKIYPIRELLEYMKDPVLHTQNYRISVTQGNNGISDRSPGKVLVLTEYQKSKNSNQTNKPLQLTFARKRVWPNMYTEGHTMTHYSFYNEIPPPVVGEDARWSIVTIDFSLILNV